MHQDSLLSPRSRLIAGRFASDERLAKLIARGDDGAFGLLYDRYHRGLYRYCLWLLRHESDAEDALQCAFLAALQSLRRGGRDLPIRPWLFRIAHNEAISVVRRRRPEQQLPDDREPHTLPLEEQVEQRESLTTLVADLRALPERQRAALLMRELSGLSHKEIALALSASVDSAKQSIFEARRSLHEFAEGRAMNCDEVCKLISDADGRMLRSRRIRSHVRHCPKCRAFAAAIDHRSRWLKAVAPGLAPAATAGLLSRGLGAPISTGDAGGMAAGFGKALGVGVSIAIKTSAITTMAAIAVGTSIQLPHMLAHQTGRAAAMPSPRLVGGASRQPRSHSHDPRTHHVGTAAAAVTRYSSSHTSQRPTTRVHTKNGWLTPGVAATSRPAGNPPPAQTGHTDGQDGDDDQNDNNQGGNSAATSGATEQTGNRSSSPSSGTGNNTDQQGDNEQTTGSAPSAQAQSAGGQAESGDQDAGNAPANTPPPNPATTNPEVDSNPPSANSAPSTPGNSSAGQNADG